MISKVKEFKLISIYMYICDICYIHFVQIGLKI